MAGKTCEICGKPSGMYPLCRDCFILRDEGKVIKDETTGKWILNEEPKKCLLCNNTTKNYLCSEHYEKMLAFKKELFSMEYSDLDSYYYNLDAYIYRYRNSQQYQNSALKLIAIAYVFKEKFNNDNFVEKAYKRIEYLNNYKEEHSKKVEKTKEQNKTDVEKEIKQRQKEEREKQETREVEKILYATDNHKVRSQQEQLIDNILYDMRIAHCYEREIPVSEEYDKKYCDWFIPIRSNISGIYIEYWGFNEFDNKEDYIKNREIKEKMYQTEKIPYISIEKEETQNVGRLTMKIQREVNRLAKECFDINEFIKNH